MQKIKLFYLKSLLIFLLALGLFNKCKDYEGKYGSIFYQVNENTFYPTLEYRDTNPDVPLNDLEWGKKYLTSAGAYDYVYKLQINDSLVYEYSGTYFLEAEKGQDSEGCRGATIGRDRYYKFYCDDPNPDFYYTYVKNGYGEGEKLSLPDTLVDCGSFNMYITRDMAYYFIKPS